MTDGEKQIIYNLRYEYKEKVSHISDEKLLKNYNDYNLSDKQTDCLDWLLDE